MAPTQSPPQGDVQIPILEQQECIMIAFLIFCLAMICAVYWGERRPVGENTNGKDVQSAQTTLLLSPDSTILGSETGSSSINKSDGTSPWPSSATYGSIDSSPTSDRSCPTP
ncbi:hypothetical protein N657DRAFT_492150 [Parathielavia appendiculata]|uniref:Uncharacterized protein n=1 Tax=Parathielavia appendiculata TaxID=2587402 RepID=A0AAN6Z266_9PEZI|nr:hypothetical protein N657DRAFT_492150 [Parathielavia appendiculata]